MALSPSKTVAVDLAAPPGTCGLCHTVDHGVTQPGLDAGEYWRCTRCGQMWDATRLATAAAYAQSVASGQLAG